MKPTKTEIRKLFHLQTILENKIAKQMKLLRIEEDFESEEEAENLYQALRPFWIRTYPMTTEEAESQSWVRGYSTLVKMRKIQANIIEKLDGVLYNNHLSSHF